jgi:hypothetical protein
MPAARFFPNPKIIWNEVTDVEWVNLVHLARELDPLARIGGPNYAGLSRFVGLPPPSRRA